MKLMKVIRFVGYGFMVISVAILVAYLATSNFTTEDYPLTDLILNWTYIMLGLTSCLAVLLPLYTMAKNPKQLIKSLAGIGIVALVLLVCYLLADATPITFADGTVQSNEGILLVSDTGLFATYVSFFVTVVAIVAGEVWTLIKKR